MLRAFSAQSGLVKTAKSFKFICQRNLSQAQATDATKLRAMVNKLISLLYFAIKTFSLFECYLKHKLRQELRLLTKS